MFRASDEDNKMYEIMERSTAEADRMDGIPSSKRRRKNLRPRPSGWVSDLPPLPKTICVHEPSQLRPITLLAIIKQILGDLVLKIVGGLVAGPFSLPVCI